MRKLSYLFGLWLLAACNEGPSSSPSVPDINVHIDRLSKPLSISAINKDQKGYLSLTNEIAFHGFSESGLFENKPLDDEKEPLADAPIRMTISSICSTENAGKFTKDIHLTRYNFDFAVIDLVPHALFFQGKTLSSSCSFFFIVTDTKGQDRRFSLKQFPLASIPENKALMIMDSIGQDLSFFKDKIIKREDMDDFFLISRDPSPQQTLTLLCDRSNNIIELADNPAAPIFRLLYTTQSFLPMGTQNCRILSQKNNKSTGITRVFKIDFSTFINEIPLIQLSTLSVRLNFLPLEPLLQPGKWHRYMNAEFDDKFFGFLDENPKPDYTSPHLTGVFELAGLPEDFLSVQYSPVKIQVDTECVGDALPEQSIKRQFNLSLVPSIPLMRVTPEEVFQMHYPASYKLPKTDEEDPDVESWAVAYKTHVNFPQQTNKRPAIGCSYTFHFQNLKTEAKVPYSPLTYPIQWNSGGIGVAYDHKDLRRGMPVFYENILSEGTGNILFPLKTQLASYPSHIRVHFEPDSIMFKCGYGLKKHPETPSFQSELSLQYTPLSLPLSEFLLHPAFKEYIKVQKAVKCRVLLYQKNQLLYFSPEIQILSQTDGLIRTLRLRGIIYDDSLSRYHIWNSIQRFFFTL